MKNLTELESTLTAFSEEIKLDCALDEVTAKEKIGLLAIIRHKWVARMIRIKQQVIILQRRRRDLINSAIASSKMPAVQLSDRALAARAANNPIIVEIDDQIENHQLVVEYLEKVEKILLAMGHDASNLVNLIKLETN